MGAMPIRKSRPAAHTISPMGPVELSYVTAMISELALDCLLQPPSQSFSRVSVTSTRRITDPGGRLSEAWLADHGEGQAGVRTVDRTWLNFELCGLWRCAGGRGCLARRRGWANRFRLGLLCLPQSHRPALRRREGRSRRSKVR